MKMIHADELIAMGLGLFAAGLLTLGFYLATL